MVKKHNEMSDNVFECTHHDALTAIMGSCDQNLKYIEKKLNVSLSARGHIILIEGSKEQSKLAFEILTALVEKYKKGDKITYDVLETVMSLKKLNISDEDSSVHQIKTKKRTVTPRTARQIKYVEALKESALTFCTGPAGTGKTYLAVAMAVAAFSKGDVDKIVLSRPALEAGEKLGFLPGDLKEKVDPYLRPLYDALHDMLAPEDIEKMMSKEKIEIAPLAFMRGRTLKNAFIILDEAQNTTSVQMKMFLTRLGEGSRMAVVGDLSQIDLPHREKSGLEESIAILKSIKNISVIGFKDEDVVRHPLVTKIISAYEAMSFTSI